MDSFERNLEQAQRELGIDPANHIPVTYSSESAWFQNLLINMLPTLLLIGAFVYFSRRVSGGSAGRGVSDGMSLVWRLYLFLPHPTTFSVSSYLCCATDCITESVEVSQIALDVKK